MATKLILIKMKQKSPLQKGVITAVLMILTSLFSLYVLKNPVESYFQIFIYIIFGAGIVWSMFGYSKSGADKKSFKDYFSYGFKTFVVIALLMTVFAYIYFILNPAFRDNKIAENSRLLILEGSHLQTEIDENAAQLKKMFMPMMLSAAIFRYLIIGAIVTAFAAVFLSKKNYESI